MYNHYIPQSDGSYRRNPQPEQRRPNPPHPRPEPPRPEPPPPSPPCPPPQSQGSILDFFKGLLPRGLDTADLMIVFLLLLMNRDDEGGISPVLTLALYFLL
jgi:hypothetical protein